MDNLTETETLEDIWPYLCLLDSDGDGRTNGVELGDPNCTWTVTNGATLTPAVSHPGKHVDSHQRSDLDPGCITPR